MTQKEQLFDLHWIEIRYERVPVLSTLDSKRANLNRRDFNFFTACLER